MDKLYPFCAFCLSVYTSCDHDFSFDPEKSQWLANQSAVYILTVLCWCYIYEAFFFSSYIWNSMTKEQRQVVLSWWSHQVPSSSQTVLPSPFIISDCLTKSLHHPKLSYHCTFISPNSYRCTFIIPNCSTTSIHYPKLYYHCTFIIPNCLTIVPSLSQTVLPLHLHYPNLFHHCTFIIPNCLTIAPPSSQTVLPLYLHYPKLSHHSTAIIPNCLTIVPSSSRPVSTSTFIIPNCLTKLLHHPKLSYHCTFIIPCSQQVSFFPNPFSFCSKLSHHVLDR